ncbi:hypothetical protein RRG08_012246 [Elysia crispata]|uniref:Uncharacterized protein n=1 Tax=Elysia crispata TaxID=231223 RepID=A0AAE0Y942_9GAST|nr:hypothetical protein RRG08_012246 [Elysia crispata]
MLDARRTEVSDQYNTVNSGAQNTSNSTTLGFCIALFWLAQVSGERDNVSDSVLTQLSCSASLFVSGDITVVTVLIQLSCSASLFVSIYLKQ